ncbi:LexA family protein [Streptomyces sp. NPDC002835]
MSRTGRRDGVGDFSERQVRILRWMRSYVAVHGEAPSLREIAAGVGLYPRRACCTSWSGSRPWVR